MDGQAVQDFVVFIATFRHQPRRTDVKPWKTSVMKVAVVFDFRTRSLPIKRIRGCTAWVNFL